jgi:hypothetical protein
MPTTCVDSQSLPAPYALGGRAREAQIFVDDSGRRARRVRAAGLALVATCTCWLGALTVGVAGFASFAPITAGLVPVPLHHALAGKPADRDRVPVAERRERPRARPARLAGPARALTPSRV